MEVGFGDEGELLGKTDGTPGIDPGYNLRDDAGGGQNTSNWKTESDKDIRRKLEKISEDIETLRFYLPRWIYVLFALLSLMTIWAVLGVLIYAVVDGGDATDQIVVIFDALDGFGEALELIIENTMVPPAAAMATRNANKKTRERSKAERLMDEAQKNREKVLMATQAIRAKLKAYLTKKGKRTSWDQLDMQENHLLKHREVRGAGAVKKPGGIETLNDLYAKTGYVNSGHKMNDENAQLYEQYKHSGAASSEHELDELQNQMSAEGLMGESLDSGGLGVQEVSVHSESPPGVLYGGIGRAFADYYSDYESRVYCRESDNVIPVFSPGDESNISHYGNVSLPCAIRHLASQMDYVIYVINNAR